MAAGQGETNPTHTSIFTEPPAPGERCTRRLLRELASETARIQSLFDTFEQSKNPRHKIQANACRNNLEQTANALRTAQDVPIDMISRVTAAISSADIILANLPALDEGEGPPAGAPTPSVSQLEIVTAPNSAFRPVVPAQNLPNAPDANGQPQTRDSDSDQGLRNLIASPQLPATPVLRPVVERGNTRPRSHDSVVPVTPDPAPAEVDRAASALSSSSRHQDAAIAIGSARHERLSERQELRKRIENHRDKMERLQLELATAESLDRAKRLDEQADADNEVIDILGEEAVEQWVSSTCARTQPVTRARPLPVASTHLQPVTHAHPQPVTLAHPQPVTLAYPQPIASAQPQMPAPARTIFSGTSQILAPSFSRPITTAFSLPTASAPPPRYMHAATQAMPTRVPYSHMATHYPPLPTHMTTSTAHWTPRSNPPPAPPPPQSPMGSGAGDGGLLQGDVATSLLTVNLRAHSRDLMVQGRPRPEKRFAGGNAQDLESFLTQFEKVTNLEGVTDQMRFSELQHWVSGPASLVVSQYENEQDSTEALTKAKAHLKKEFGRKLVTARQMLDQLLTGPKYKESDTAGIQVFILKLNQVHKRALETQRDQTFNTKETYDDILCKKLPFFSRKWSARWTNSEEAIAATQDYSHALTFGQFLEFCRWMNACNSNHRSTFKNDTSASTSTTEPNGKSGKKIAATGVEVAATTTSRPKQNKKPSFPAKKAQTNATNGPQSQAMAPKPNGQGPKPKPAPTVSKETSPKPPARGCLACNNGSHSLDSCREFLKMSDEDKRQFVKKKGICYLCLQHGHMAAACPCEISCQECSKRHNTVFHRERKQDPEES